ncbi:pseudaminic acid cytidylyltransferase [Erythrobacter sp. HL-111]|uniref:pseudaminic acid cytidylyltransferase n=1 Tax=Erythrobacter sp. HL-111 TaxID=1798193 RepID=UPI0006DA57EB|nr:pseudaminic acid cytidylyltransferase [Erythrobacter sp. HL-111]KPP95465.1 MAG: pseudaminic acid cytidylyltransferase [Erythrobacteraceae bacterium HL-111]SDS71824.1 pseudaminic acid cytidylyltransferase [Erythrobacter sp. HL-111]
MDVAATIAIIPARGGSKRIPRKNVRPFAGKPMIAHAIEAALACDAIGRVIVSTDDDAIAAIAAGHGAEVPFRRPGELADDITPTVPVIQHAIRTLRELGHPVDRVCCIYPGVPFIRTRDIADALALLVGHGDEGYTFPVTSFPSPIQRALRRGSDGALTPFDPAHVETRTQDLEPAYFDAGQFYWGAAETWLSGANIHLNGRAIVLPEWRVVDIDTPEDWTRAEALHRALQQEG